MNSVGHAQVLNRGDNSGALNAVDSGDGCGAREERVGTEAFPITTRGGLAACTARQSGFSRGEAK
jgi:hypothetical protein